HQSRTVLWVLMLSIPFPYFATTAAWWTAELGRQPWLIHGLMRTADGGSPQVNTGNVVFTTLGFAGLYLVLGILFLFQVMRVLNRGPVCLLAGLLEECRWKRSGSPSCPRC